MSFFLSCFRPCCRDEGRPPGHQEGPGRGHDARATSRAAYGDHVGSEAAAAGRPRGTPDGPKPEGVGRRGEDHKRPVATQAHHQEEKEVPLLQVENQQVKQKAHDLEEENSHISAEIHHLKQEAEVLKEQVSNLQVENQQVKQKAHDLEEENSHRSAEIHHLKQEAEILKEQVSNLQVENQWVKQKAHDLEEKNSHISAEIQHLKREAQELKEQVSTFQVENRVLQETQKFGYSQAASVASQVVKKILPAWPSVPLGLSPGKVFHVQIRVAGKTGGAEKKFLKDTEKLLSGQSISLKLKEFTKTSRDLLLVFCPIASRMGTDIQNALQGLSGDQKAILVVMHYVPKDNTETFLDASRQGTHPALVLTVHTRYTLQGGFYPCEMNKRAMDDVADAIKGLAEDP